jgi:GTPase involved in cell partitioning and DNA repair
MRTFWRASSSVKGGNGGNGGNGGRVVMARECHILPQFPV